MFALVIEREGEPARRRVFGRQSNVAIGRAEHCGVLLDDPAIAEVHALVIVEKDRLSIQAHRGSSVFVDGKSIGERATKLTSARIGAYTIRLETLDQPRTKLTLAATEEQLLAEIAGGDDASRLVYADWLEQRGDTTRAEFLRVQHALGSLAADDATFPAATDRLRELGAHVNILWRAQVARPSIEGCEGFDFQCPKEWGSLQPTGREKVRHCTACKSDVFYSTSIAEARRHAADGKCVALDLNTPRWEDDLAGPFGENTCRSCKLDVGPTVPTCPRCATRVRPEMLRGRMVMTPRVPDEP